MKFFRAARLAPLLAAVFVSGPLSSALADSVIPRATDGRPLNLGFEAGDLRDWQANGKAFDQALIRGDVVSQRRADMKSNHEGEFWIGGFERTGDDPKGTLTSVPFKVTHPWASFLVAGGPWPETRVELVDSATGQTFFKISGSESETLRPVVVELKGLIGKQILVRLVDDRSGHWGHLNFDNFRFHTERPVLPSELTLKDTPKNAAPPADQVLFAGLSAADAAAKATLPSGFAMHVFASEPDIRNPIAFCEDHRGRLWVAEGLSYPKRVGHPPANGTPEQLRKDIFSGKDRILVFEDTDGDHKADKRTVFLENVNLISGMEFGFGGLWVGAAPYLMFIPIADGDAPKPAGDPQILLDGWNYTADTHETLNTFNWGPDGWLYGCHGVFCPSHVGKPGAIENDRQWVDAGVWRYHPVTHRFEIFTEGGSNPWGIDFDEHGNLWSEMCVIPHLFHMIQGARVLRQGGEHYTYNRDETQRNAKHRDQRSRKSIFPYVYEDIGTHADHVHWAGAAGPHAANGRSDARGGGHAHAGMLCYLGKSWPASYRNNLIIGNIHGQRMNVDLPVARGSGYVGKHGQDLLNFNDRWSQTLNQRLDPDGSVFVIDWYDANQCHHGRDDGHDHSSGRIYKIVYQNQPVTRTNLAALTPNQLVSLVGSKNEWLSRHARRVLQERVAAAGAQESVDEIPAGIRDYARTRKAAEKMPALEALLDAVDGSGDATSRLRALWALHLTGRILPEDAARWIRDPEPQIRAWAVQTFFEHSGMLFNEPTFEQLAGSAVEALVALATEDPSPVVRRAVASAAQRVPAAQRWGILKGLLSHAEDASDFNLPLLYWYATEGPVSTDADRATELLKECKIPKVREFIARRLTQMALAKN